MARRIGRFVALGLLIAAAVSAVALAVDKQGGKSADDIPEATVTVTGVLHKTADGYTVGTRAVSFGPPWYASGSSLINERLGKSVTVTGAADDDDGGLDVRTIDGVAYRPEGRPPWAGGAKQHGPVGAGCKEKARAEEKAKSKAKVGEDDGEDERSERSEKSERVEKVEKSDKRHGPPPWAKAGGHRCKG